jgi:hypothetical protein
VLLLGLLVIIALLAVFGGSGGSGGSVRRDGGDEDVDELVELDILTDGRLDGHIGPRDP